MGTTAEHSTVDVGEASLCYGDPHDLLGIVEVFILDVYPARLLRRGDVVLDVGAGIGDFAIRASRRIGPDGLVVAIEPSPSDYELMLTNLSMNRCTNVLPLNYAIGREAGSVEFTFKGRTYKSVTRSLTGLLKDASPTALPRALGSPTFLKMDVEGAEVAALEGLGDSVTTIRTVAIELHQTEAAVDRLLVPEGFRFEPISRTHYLSSAARYAIRHPILAWRVWGLLGAYGERPTLSKMLRGIELVKGTQLRVGTYVRAADNSPASR